MLGGLNFRSNAIGFLRLLFAAAVVWSHAYGQGHVKAGIVGIIGARLHVGFMAVAGFFILSGFLITRSYESLGNPGRFLWHRFLRIYPGFWVCLVVIAFVFAPLAFLRAYGNLHGFLSQTPSPIGYVINNFTIQINQPVIGSVIATLPEPRFLNGSLWTLEWECLCYLSVLAAGAAALLKRRRLPIALATMLVLLLFCGIGTARQSQQELLFVWVVLLLGVYFWVGACAYLFRDYIPMKGWIASICAVIAIASIPSNFSALVTPLTFGYVVLYAAMCLPIRSFDRRTDLSYGLYIYAFPIQQLLTLYGLDRFGVAIYFLMALTMGLIIAAASWFCVERPALSLKGYGARATAESAQAAR